VFWRRKPKEPQRTELEPAAEPAVAFEPAAEPTEPAAEPTEPAAEPTEPAAEPAVAFEPGDLAAPPAAEPSPTTPPPPESAEEAPGDLAEGLEKSRGGFMSRLRGLLRSGPADADWEEVEETLIAGDVGGALAARVVEKARGRRDVSSAQAAVRDELASLLIPNDPTWSPQPAAPGQPVVILVVGVNGTGKTTTIGKLAHRYRGQGRSVLLAAADTFRAAATEQLRIWADRAGCQFVAHAPGADPAAVVYDAVDAAIARNVEVVIADTAGRLHTKSNLMDELAKMRRVADRRLPGSAPEVLFVLDATTGQNGLAQAKVFHETVGLTGIVLTKLDSTAKGGIVFAIEDTLGVPVRFVGVGERLGDLLPFDPKAFVDALFAQ
jgi:fused signal recognition particle receptor